MRTLTFSGRDADPSASHDGRLVAFTSARDGASRIWVKQLAGGGEAPLTAGPDQRARFSPDDSSILFVRDLGGTQAIYRIALVGGEPRKLVDDATEGDWSPDGKTIVFVRTREGAEVVSSLNLFDTEAGKESLLYEVRGRQLLDPRWAPDGRAVAFVAGNRNSNAPSWQLLRADPRSREVRPMPGFALGNAVGGIAWSGSGRELFLFQSASVLGDVAGAWSRILRADARTGQRTALLWADGLAPLISSEDHLARCDVAAPGRLVFGHRLRRQNLRELSLADLGSPPATRLLTEGTSVDRQPAYSGDGRRVLFSSNRGGNLDLWALDLASGALSQLTDDAAQDWDPAFSGGGKHILWDNDRQGHLEVWMANADGSGAHQLTHDGADAENPSPTPDERWIVYWSGNPSHPGVWKVHPDGSAPTRLVAGSIFYSDVSPDGRHAAYVTRDRAKLRNTVHFVEVESGRPVPFTIDVPFTAAGPAIIWGRSRWSPDGRTIYFVGQDAAGRSGVFAQGFTPGHDSTSTRRPVAGFSTEFVTESLGLSPDGSRLTVSTGQELSTVMIADGVPGAIPPAR